MTPVKENLGDAIAEALKSSMPRTKRLLLDLASQARSSDPWLSRFYLSFYSELER